MKRLLVALTAAGLACCVPLGAPDASARLLPRTYTDASVTTSCLAADGTSLVKAQTTVPVADWSVGLVAYLTSSTAPFSPSAIIRGETAKAEKLVTWGPGQTSFTFNVIATFSNGHVSDDSESVSRPPACPTPPTTTEAPPSTTTQPSSTSSTTITPPSSTTSTVASSTSSSTTAPAPTTAAPSITSTVASPTTPAATEPDPVLDVGCGYIRLTQDTDREVIGKLMFPDLPTPTPDDLSPTVVGPLPLEKRFAEDEGGGLIRYVVHVGTHVFEGYIDTDCLPLPICTGHPELQPYCGTTPAQATVPPPPSLGDGTLPATGSDGAKLFSVWAGMFVGLAAACFGIAGSRSADAGRRHG